MQLRYDGSEPRVYCPGHTIYVEPGDVIDVDDAVLERLIATGQFSSHTPTTSAPAPDVAASDARRLKKDKE